MNPLGHLPIPPSFHVGRILFATDFSDASNRALPIAGTMARTFRAELTIAHVWAEPVCTVPEAVYGCSAQIEHSVRQCLLDVAERPELVGIDTRSAFKAGRVVESLIAMAEELQADMIVCGTHGRTGVSHAVMGSVAEALVRRSRAQY
jgi:nucleotide-binding universal stress UspA family protein